MITPRKIFKFLFNMKYYFIYWNRFRGLTKKQEKYLLEKQFKWLVGYKLNLDNPKSFNEKIQWLKLNYHAPLLTKCADKYAVREYVKEKIGEEYLIPLLRVWNSPDEIDFDSLPDKFVLKVNWGSGQNIIVKDKSKLNIVETREKLKNWMKPEANHYWMGLEWCYKDIQPKIIAEEYMQQLDGDLYDYKFLAYGGKVQNLFIVSDRFKNMHVDFYDREYKRLRLKRLYENSSSGIPKPDNYEKMVELAEKLAEGLPFVRADFYSVNDKIYFGEMTFYPGGGFEPFEPVEWDYKFGDMIDLEPLIKGENK